MKGKFLYSRKENILYYLFPLFLIDFTLIRRKREVVLIVNSLSYLMKMVGFMEVLSCICQVFLKEIHIFASVPKYTLGIPVAVSVPCSQTKVILGYIESLTFLQITAITA